MKVIIGLPAATMMREMVRDAEGQKETAKRDRSGARRKKASVTALQLVKGK